MNWRPRRALVVVVGAAATGVLFWALLLAVAPLDRVVGAVIALVLSAGSLWAWRRRFTGGPRGLLIRGLGGDRLVPWSQVRSVEVVQSRRLGLASTTLEVDLVDDELLVFGRTDLGTDPAAVLAELRSFSPPV